jgi:hypothetical protein
MELELTYMDILSIFRITMVEITDGYRLLVSGQTLTILVGLVLVPLIVVVHVGVVETLLVFIAFMNVPHRVNAVGFSWDAHVMIKTIKDKGK